RGAQFSAQRELAPPADGRGEFDPVVKRDPEGGHANRGERDPRSRTGQQIPGGRDAAVEAGPRAQFTPAADGGRAEPGPVQAADFGGDLGSAEVEPEHNGSLDHGAYLRETGIEPRPCVRLLGQYPNYLRATSPLCEVCPATGLHPSCRWPEPRSGARQPRDQIRQRWPGTGCHTLLPGVVPPALSPGAVGR